MDITRIVSPNGDDGQWYRIPGTEAQLKIRQIKPKRQREIIRECTRKFTRRRQLIEEVDNERANRLFLLESVVDWKAVEKDGTPLAVTNENKVLLDDNWPAFSDLWNNVLVREDELVASVEEAELGNSASGESST